MKWIVIILGVFAAIIILLASTPALFSTKWGNQIISSIINKRIPGKVEIQHMHLSWFTGQNIDGFILRDPEGAIVTKADKLGIDTPLFSFISYKNINGIVTVQNLEAVLTEDSQGKTNLQRAIGYPEKSTAITLGQVSRSPVNLQNVNGSFSIPADGQPFLAHIRGNTSLGSIKGMFSIDADLDGIDMAVVKSMHLNSSLKGTLKAHVENFPVQVIDQVVTLFEPSLSGLFRSGLGETLNLSIDNTVQNGGIGFKAAVVSPHLSGNIIGTINDERIAFAQPGTVTWTVTPAFVQKISPKAVLKDPVKTIATIDVFSAPVNSSFAIDNIDIKGRIVSESLVLNGNTLDGFLLEIPSVHEAILTRFPVLLADQLLRLDGLAVAALGDRANAKIQSKGKLYDLQLQTDKLSISTIPLNISSKAISLEKPIIVNFLITPAFLSKISPNSSFLDVKEDLSSLLKIDTFSIPFDNVLNGTIAGEFSLATISLANISSLGNFSLSDLKLEFKGKNISNADFDLTGRIISNNTQGITPEVLGGKANILLNGNVVLSKDNTFSLPKLAGHIQTDRGHLSFSGRIDYEHLFSLEKPAEFIYTLTPEAMADLGLAQEGKTSLVSPTTIEISVSPSKTPIGKFNNLHLTGQMNLSPLSIGLNGTQIASITDLYAPWELNGPANSIKLNISGRTANQNSGKKGQVNANIDVKNWRKGENLDLSGLNINANVALEELPMAILSTFMEHDDLQYVIGDSLNGVLNSNIQFGQSSQGTIQLKAETPLLEIDGDFAIHDSLTLASEGTPASVKWKLTPEGFSRLRHFIKGPEENVESLFLLEPTVVDIKIAGLNIPFTEKRPYATGGLTANASIGKLSLSDRRTRKNSTFESIVANFNSQNMSDSIAFHLSGRDGISSGSRKEAQITFDGYLKNLFTARGKWNAPGMTLVVETKADALPVGLLGNLLFLDSQNLERIDALVGDHLDINMNIYLQQMNGTADAHFNGTNGKVSFNAALNNGILTLTKPFEAEVKMTPKLSKAILQDIMPLFSSAKSAQAPIKVTISPDGFAIPVHPFNISNATIGLATLNIGKVEFTNEGQLGTILELLKPLASNQSSVWFTPLYVHMKNGDIHLERVDMLVNEAYPIASWGKVDLVKDKVNMMIGLTGTALKNALGIKSLTEKDMLQIPVKGTIATAGIDKAKATARIAALVAQSQGGLKGMIFGTVLNIATSEGDPTPPEPTTKPFPWEKK